MIFLPVCWIVSAILLNWGLRRIHYLSDSTPGTSPRSSISVVIAARNEGHTIAAALRSILAQDYANCEVVVVNDRSTDDTANVLATIANENPQLRVVQVDRLPAGWIGKNHALHAGAAATAGDYILFTDADIVMECTVLARAMHFVERKNLDHLAIFPHLPAPSYLAGSYYTLFGLGFLMLTQPWFVREGRMPIPVGIGAFNMIRRRTYDACGGHERIRLRPDDDIALARIVRDAGGTQDVVIGGPFVSVDWYPNLRAAIRGAEKNSFAPFEYSLPIFSVAVLIHFVMYLAPWLLLIIPGMRALAAITVIAQMSALASTERVAAGAWRYTPALPVAALIFEYAIIRAVVLTYKQGGIRWRDTFYSLRELKSNRLSTRDTSAV